MNDRLRRTPGNQFDRCQLRRVRLHPLGVVPGEWPHVRRLQDDIDERVQASEPVRDTQERGVGRWQRGAQPTLAGGHD